MVFQTNFTFVFLVLLIYYNSLDLVLGKPNLSTIVAEDLESVDTEINDGERSQDLTRIGRTNLAHLDLTDDVDCSKRGGCYKGYCWAGCTATMFAGSEWCYTSKLKKTQSFSYVRCNSDSQCSKCWHCAGACSV